jgi:RND family efflux transporter MFP subunit
MYSKSLFLLVLAVAVVVSSCTTEDNTAKLKSELDQKKQALSALRAEIAELEKKVSAADPAFAAMQDKSVLVSVEDAALGVFEHKIRVRGNVGSRKNVTLSSEAMGKVVTVHIQEGDRVKAGTLLVSLDVSVLQKNIQEMTTSLELLRTLYEKQERLWKQNIGSEIQYLQAKNNKESMERRIAALEAQVALAKVKAPFDATVENVYINAGEMAAPGMPICALVGDRDSYLQADISEEFLGKFRKGDKVQVYFPSQDATINTQIAAVGDIIKEDNRTFKVEVQLPVSDSRIKPNLTALLDLTDYVNKQAITVSSNVIQNDNKGQYVFVVKQQEDKKIAEKRYITRGMSFSSRTEVLSGINPGETIVSDGVSDVVEGVEIRIAK